MTQGFYCSAAFCATNRLILWCPALKGAPVIPAFHDDAGAKIGIARLLCLLKRKEFCFRAVYFSTVPEKLKPNAPL